MAGLHVDVCGALEQQAVGLQLSEDQRVKVSRCGLECQASADQD